MSVVLTTQLVQEKHFKVAASGIWIAADISNERFCDSKRLQFVNGCMNRDVLAHRDSVDDVGAANDSDNLAAVHDR